MMEQLTGDQIVTIVRMVIGMIIIVTALVCWTFLRRYT
jgi:hypothetical protein